MPLRIAFDIGGVLSKYPEVFCPLIDHLQRSGAEVYILTDMHDMTFIMETLRMNSVPVDASHVFSADYDTYGEGCKAELLRELHIDMFFDDFIGYVAPMGCPVRCLVMPDASQPYYHPLWKTPNDEDFGRKAYYRKGSLE